VPYGPIPPWPLRRTGFRPRQCPRRIASRLRARDGPIAIAQEGCRFRTKQALPDVLSPRSGPERPPRSRIGPGKLVDAEVRNGLTSDNSNRGNFSRSVRIWRIVSRSLRKFLTNSENPAPIKPICVAFYENPQIPGEYG